MALESDKIYRRCFLILCIGIPVEAAAILGMMIAYSMGGPWSILIIGFAPLFLIAAAVLNIFIKNYKKCFYILCWGILADVVMKLGLWAFTLSLLANLIVIGIEFALLGTAVSVNIFTQAKDGICLPPRRYRSVSLIAAAVVAAPFLFRTVTGMGLILGGIVTLLFFAGTFAICFLIFHLAFRKAQKTGNNKITGSGS